MGSWLLDAAMRRRTEELIESHGSELVTDACDSGGRLRHRFARNLPKASRSKPVQLALWTFLNPSQSPHDMR